jgi:multicomponent Na+:H+ antiporter subunit E
MLMTFAAPPGSSGRQWRAATVRTVGFALIWLVLHGAAPAGLPVGLVTAAAAASASLRLLAPGTGRLAPARALLLGARFIMQSAVAGTDVARRALSPRMALTLGFVRYHPRLPPGPALNAFCAWTSLLPGSLCCEIAEDGALLLHCLDTTQPVAAQMAAEEARFIAALGLR